MNKTELIAAIAKETELSRKDAELAVKAFADVVTAELKKGEKVQLVGFGTFEVSERAACSKRGKKSADWRDNDHQRIQNSEIQGRQGFEGCSERIKAK